MQMLQKEICKIYGKYLVNKIYNYSFIIIRYLLFCLIFSCKQNFSKYYVYNYNLYLIIIIESNLQLL